MPTNRWIDRQAQRKTYILAYRVYTRAKRNRSTHQKKREIEKDTQVRQREISNLLSVMVVLLR